MQPNNSIPESSDVQNETAARSGQKDAAEPVVSYHISAANSESGVDQDWTWHGTWAEYMSLRAAVHKSYRYSLHSRSEMCFCEVHLVQREWDGLLFARHIAQQLIVQEMTPVRHRSRLRG